MTMAANICCNRAESVCPHQEKDKKNLVNGNILPLTNICCDEYIRLNDLKSCSEIIRPTTSLHNVLRHLNMLCNMLLWLIIMWACKGSSNKEP